METREFNIESMECCIGPVLLQLMEEREINLHKLSYEVEVPYSRMWKWLKSSSGRIIIDRGIERLCDYFGVSTDYLLFAKKISKEKRKDAFEGFKGRLNHLYIFVHGSDIAEGEKLPLLEEIERCIQEENISA